MNVGYSKVSDLENPTNNECCPICGKNIYVSKYWSDFACVDVKCPLGHGANNLESEINKLLEKRFNISIT